MKTVAEQQQRIKVIQNIIEGIDIIFNEKKPLKQKQSEAFQFAKGYAIGYSTASSNTEAIDPIVYFALLRGGDIRTELANGIEILRNSIHDTIQLEKEIG